MTILPAALPPSLPEWELRSLPAMVMRQAYTWTSEMHPDLNVHLKLNKGRMHSDAYISGVMDARHGSSIYYASPPGFVHTAMWLLSNGTSATRPPADQPHALHLARCYLPSALTSPLFEPSCVDRCARAAATRA